MTQLKYPVGIQTFSKLIEGGYSYVDKTDFVRKLISNEAYYFLSRPRRFGKSLMVSTLKAYFEGRRDLFRGLALDEADVSWDPVPVLHFDFNNGLYESASGLLVKMDKMLADYEVEYDIPVGSREREEIPLRFQAIIKAAYDKTGKKVTILVDEYDKPLFALEDKETFEKHQKLLKSFYGNLKTMDGYIGFCFITGVARFGKVSIFSDLNNLDDISLDNNYADICGWTEEELNRTFSQGIKELADELGKDPEATTRLLRDYYDGYMFTPKGSRLYNPYSVLRALKTKEVDPYWFTSGTPSFLVKRIKSMGIFPRDINGKTCTRQALLQVGMNDHNPLPLMFQTGYLTIGSYDSQDKVYQLRFPNYEVETGFYHDLLNAYSEGLTDSLSRFDFTLFQNDLKDGRPYDFMQRLEGLFKDLPGEDHSESVYRAMTFLLATLCGTHSLAEHNGYKGRSDLEVTTARYVYIFEFKYNRSVQEAMDQILTRDYAGRYAKDSRTIYLIGANFDEKKGSRGLTFEIQNLNTEE